MSLILARVLRSGSSRHGERGQTFPFWVGAVLLSFGLTYFTFNYANSVRWQIRAQNAADSAATAILGQDAAIANSAATLEYAIQLQDVRTRSVGNDLKSIVGLASSDKNCSNLLALNCVQDLTTVANTLTTDTKTYDKLVGQMSSFVGQTTDIIGSSTSANDLLNGSLLGSGSGTGGVGCIKLNTDCGFRYTTSLRIDPTTGRLIVDEEACRQVPTADAGIIGMVSTMFGQTKARGNVFYAIGHASEELAPASSGPIDPGRDTNPLTNEPYELASTIDPQISGTQNVTNLSEVSISTGFLIPKAVPPGGPAYSIATLCGPPSQ